VLLRCHRGAPGVQGGQQSGVKTEAEWADVEREARVLLQLRGSCTGIVQLREALETELAVQLVMEICTGGDLFDLLNAHGRLHRLLHATSSRSKWRPRRATTRGVMHRDIKPGSSSWTSLHRGSTP